MIAHRFPRPPSRLDLRIGAAGAIAAAAGVGLLVGRSPALSRLVAAAGLLVPALALHLLVAARRGAGGVDSGADVTGMTVIVPANDEVAVVADLVADLATQQPPCRPSDPCVRVVIVDDRSVDGTGDVVRAAISELRSPIPMEALRRSAGRATKGAALACVPIDPRPTEIVAVLDADARISSSFLRDVLGAARSGIAVGTARRRMLLPARGRLARLLAIVQDDEQTLDGEIQLGRWALGGGSELRGNGMFVRADILAEVGGWSADALCEDLELTSRIYLTPDGPRPRWLPGIEVWEQPVLSLPALVRQRLRWARGAVRRDVQVTLPSLIDRRIPLARRVDAAAYAAQTLAPFAGLGMLAGGRRGIALIGRLSACYIVGVMALAAASLRRSTNARGGNLRPVERGLRAVGVTVFGMAWVAITPVAWCATVVRPHAVTFERTRHLAGGFCPPG
ncbi:MAG TPA: glycosyltransferase family 2 protein [Candidatus Dormibacteraeota bacterium]|nr:glycosyltransferase family 2 protein [Candidatus Dormibacteraeota bacterium]